MRQRRRLAPEPATAAAHSRIRIRHPQRNIFPRPNSNTAELTIPEGGAEGEIPAVGSFSVGWSLYIKDGKPNFRYTFFDVADVTIAGSDQLPEGKVTLRTEFTPDGTKEGGGTLKMIVNGTPAGEGKLKRTVFRHGLEPFEVGRDSITPVAPDYKTPFAFTGSIEKVTFEFTKK